MRLRETALQIVVKLRTYDHIICAAVIIYPEGGAAAVTGHEIQERVIDAFRLRSRFPADCAFYHRMGHENPIMTALVDRHMEKMVVSAGGIILAG